MNLKGFIKNYQIITNLTLLPACKLRGCPCQALLGGALNLVARARQNHKAFRDICDRTQHPSRQWGCLITQGCLWKRFQKCAIRLGPESSATWMGQFPIWKLKWDFLKTSVTACTIDKKCIFCPIWNLLHENWNLKRFFLKKVMYNPLMGYTLFQATISKWELP